MIWQEEPAVTMTNIHTSRMNLQNNWKSIKKCKWCLNKLKHNNTSQHKLTNKHLNQVINNLQGIFMKYIYYLLIVELTDQIH